MNNHVNDAIKALQELAVKTNDRMLYNPETDEVVILNPTSKTVTLDSLFPKKEQRYEK